MTTLHLGHIDCKVKSNQVSPGQDTRRNPVRVNLLVQEHTKSEFLWLTIIGFENVLIVTFSVSFVEFWSLNLLFTMETFRYWSKWHRQCTNVKLSGSSHSYWDPRVIVNAAPIRGSGLFILYTLSLFSLRILTLNTTHVNLRRWLQNTHCTKSNFFEIARRHVYLINRRL